MVVGSGKRNCGVYYSTMFPYCYYYLSDFKIIKVVGQSQKSRGIRSVPCPLPGHDKTGRKSCFILLNSDFGGSLRVYSVGSPDSGRSGIKEKRLVKKRNEIVSIFCHTGMKEIKNCRPLA